MPQTFEDIVGGSQGQINPKERSYFSKEYIRKIETTILSVIESTYNALYRALDKWGY